MLRIVKKYFEIVPVFRYKDIKLEERLALAFYMTGFILAVIAFVTTLFVGSSFWINIPNLILLLLCLLLPFFFSNHFSKIARILVYVVGFVYLPITYYINGGHNGVGIMYFLMMAIYFSFFLKGKRLVYTIIGLLGLYVVVIVVGFNYPQLVIDYPDELSRVIDMIVSLIAISAILAVISKTVFESYSIEKERENFLTIQLAKRNKQLELLSTTDQLTQVYNRRYFLKALQDEFDSFVTNGKHFYLLMIDIDDFKKINDSYGHLYGDEILKMVAQTIKGVLRDHDIVCRYGGEEFSVIISQINDERGFDIAERIREAVEKIEYRHECNVTISLGIVKNTFKDSLSGIIQKADNYLYEAKAKGKNIVIGEDD